MQDLVITQNSLMADVFNFDGVQLRVVKIGSEPWFVATDVATALDYRDAEKLVRNIDDDERGTQNVGTLGGTQQMLVINESGLYSAILKSRKPEALRFKKWVTSVLLPMVRRGEVAPVQKPSIDDRLVAMMERQTASFDNSLSIMSRILDRLSEATSAAPVPQQEPVRALKAEKPAPARKPADRMTVLAVGRKIGLDYTSTNDLFEELGLHIFVGGRYAPTKKAAPYLAESVGNQLRWNEDVFKIITDKRIAKYR